MGNTCEAALSTASMVSGFIGQLSPLGPTPRPLGSSPRRLRISRGSMRLQAMGPSVNPNWKAETRSKAEPWMAHFLLVSLSRIAIIAAVTLFSPSAVFKVNRGESPCATQRR
ncbi:Uncharacterised protein [Mycobacteroides abscessus subsp. massiliense]|nr:Uncharacterised protein [Mycobacteroides abscessus subsp. massiliense]